MNDTTLQAAIARSFDTNARAPLLEDAAGKITSYGDIAAGARRLQGALAAAGVTPGERVLVQIDKSPHALMLYVACLAAGAIYLPLNNDYTEAELAYFVGDAEPALAVCRPESEAIFARLLTGRRGTALRTMGVDGGGTLARDARDGAQGGTRAPQDTAAILYTSGTTGRPKGAMLSQANLLSNARLLISEWRFTSSDVLIHALPLFHAHGLFVAVHCTLLAGSRIMFHARFEPDAVIAALPRATVFMGVPTYYTRLLAHPGFTRDAASQMRLFLSGSAPLTAETFRDFDSRIGMRILERYGMTETLMLTSNRYDGPRIAGSVGAPLPGVALRIAAEGGAVLPQGEVGVVEVKGPSIFQGYWRNPEKTADAFAADGFFRTGDLGRLDETGYLHLVGRGSDLIISGGLNVYPKEIEAALDALPGVGESTVVGVPHADFGEAVLALVVAKDGAPLDGEALRAALRPVLARFKIPKQVLVVDELPRNTMGKVQKAELRKRYAKLFAETST